MPDIFLSYSRKDRPVAEALAASLQGLGFEVWWDMELLGGENYRKKTADIIKRASSTIVIWSRASVESEWVVGEASAAREAKTLIPVNIDRSDAPLDFRVLNAIDLSEWAPGDALPDMLVKAVCDKTGRKFAPSYLPAGNNMTVRKAIARSWYADFESIFFALISQGFASALTMIPLATHHDKVSLFYSILIAGVISTTSAAIIMRSPLSTKRLGVAAPWFAVSVATGVAAYFVTLTFWELLSLNEYLTFVGFWSLGLVVMLDVSRRSS